MHLIRVVAYSSLINKDINADLAAEALKDIIPSSKPKVITIHEIQKTVGEHYSIKLEDFKAKKRTKSVAFPRQIAMYLITGINRFFFAENRRRIWRARSYDCHPCP